MKAGWYIVNYHDVSFEDSILTRAIGGVLRPDQFRRQLQYLQKSGRFCTIAEGHQRLRDGRLDQPYVSLWFDDGYRGLQTHAAQICAEFGVRPAVSICSRFALREEMFWRCKLSALAHLDGLRVLRSRLRKAFGQVPFKIRKWSLQNYSETFQSILDQTYLDLTDEAFRNDAFRIFLDVDGLRSLAREGWDLVNHSAGHTPWSEAVGWEGVLSSFRECEGLLNQLGGKTDYWVIPFDFGFQNYQQQAAELDQCIVRVGNRPNLSGADSQLLWRHAAPESTRFKGFLR